MGRFHISESLPRKDAERGARAVVLVASGELDYGASPQLKERIRNHIAAGRRHLVLDLTAVTFIDSTAIGTLVGAVTRLREVGGGSVRVVCTEENERVLRIFEISGVANLIALHESLGEALSAVDMNARPIEVRAWVVQATASAHAGETRLAARHRGQEAVRTYTEEATTAVGGRPGAAISRTVDELA
jgi:anti-sigma B factor antagonist